jgi:hypothetical protein
MNQGEKNGWNSCVLAHHLPSVTTQAGRMGGKPATPAQHNVEQKKQEAQEDHQEATK